MSRKIFKYDETLDEVVEVTARSSGADHRFIPDIKPFTLPDGTQITSRSILRAYEQKHGVRQSGDEWTGSTKPQWWDSWKKGELRG